MIKSLNSTSGFGKKVSAVALVGSDGQKVSYSVQPDGLHIAALTKPTNVEHAFVFRVHLDGSKMGFVAFDRHDGPGIRRGHSNTLKWLSGSGGGGGGAPAKDEVVLELWSAERSAWQLIAVTEDDGVYEWQTPKDVAAPLLLRVRARHEDGIEHVVQLPLA